MDYGTFLKQQGHGKITQSKHYSKQSKFDGSRRQIRGNILRLLATGPMLQADLLEQIEDERTVSVLDDLAREHLIQRHGNSYDLS